ncbi:hypothetical protein CTI12_AA211460 [Artemisia annua]|uniref:Translation initiation factor 5A-like N-terminal domain-containing protein n=1 Tax=Artemisia annua TaxID=35608 RepID=A0A2U1NZ63_ARTAN|nr:hypothetical protein CTI12_AA211460 [Artemisia annua]
MALICKQVVEVSTSKTGKHGHAKCRFVAIDIFNGKKLEDIVPSSHSCDKNVIGKYVDKDIHLRAKSSLQKQQLQRCVTKSEIT